MRYGDNIDYLIAAITYLGTHSYYWARTPSNMASELSLDRNKLAAIFDGFPGIFRKSAEPAPGSKEHFYSLQARYAMREGAGTREPEQVSYIAPLSVEMISQLNSFVLHASQMETEGRKQFWGNIVSVGAAIVAALTAIAVAFLKE